MNLSRAGGSGGSVIGRGARAGETARRCRASTSQYCAHGPLGPARRASALREATPTAIINKGRLIPIAAELVEPKLFFTYVPEAAARFAPVRFPAAASARSLTGTPHGRHHSS